MVEKIKKVSNPLTIIAIFAALAEINGTVAIGIVRPELQEIFIWFMIGFPTILILLFFLTLNFNPKVIYAPSDFQNEENFLKIVSGNIYLNKINYKVSPKDNDIETVREQVKEAIKVSKQATQLPIEERNLVNKANSFFEIFIDEIQILFDQNKMERLGFSIHSPEFFLLDFSIPKNILNSPNRADEYSVIIKIKVESEKLISLEAVGKGIKEIDQKVFASKVATLVKNIVESSTNPNQKLDF